MFNPLNIRVGDILIQNSKSRHIIIKILDIKYPHDLNNGILITRSEILSFRWKIPRLCLPGTRTYEVGEIVSFSFILSNTHRYTWKIQGSDWWEIWT
jgi:hypothetical protein